MDYGQIFTVCKSTVWYLPIIHLRIFRPALTDRKSWSWIDWCVFRIGVTNRKKSGFLERCLTRKSVLFFIEFKFSITNYWTGKEWEFEALFRQQGDCLLYLFSKKWRKKMFLRSADKMSGASCQYSTEIGVESFKPFLFSLLLFHLLTSLTTRSPNLFSKNIKDILRCHTFESLEA